jgi:hypothetical protein
VPFARELATTACRAKVPKDVWPEFEARVQTAYQAPAPASQDHPNAFDERAVLKLMLGLLIRAAERWRTVKVTEFERRQLAAAQTMT